MHHGGRRRRRGEVGKWKERTSAPRAEEARVRAVLSFAEHLLETRQTRAALVASSYTDLHGTAGVRALWREGVNTMKR